MDEPARSMIDVESVLDDILQREGGYVELRADRGGPTNRGITLGTLSAWLHREATVDELKALTPEEAKNIYRQAYIVDPGFGAIGSQALMALVVDAAVNHGVKRATQMLQRALGVTDDGVLGPVTQKAIQQADFNRVYLNLCAERVEFYGRLIEQDHTQAIFAAGWANRIAEFIRAA